MPGIRTMASEEETVESLAAEAEQMAEDLNANTEELSAMSNVSDLAQNEAVLNVVLKIFCSVTDYVETLHRYFDVYMKRELGVLRDEVTSRGRAMDKLVCEETERLRDEVREELGDRDEDIAHETVEKWRELETVMHDLATRVGALESRAQEVASRVSRDLLLPTKAAARDPILPPPPILNAISADSASRDQLRNSQSAREPGPFRDPPPQRDPHMGRDPLPQRDPHIGRDPLPSREQHLQQREPVIAAPMREVNAPSAAPRVANHKEQPVMTSSAQPPTPRVHEVFGQRGQESVAHRPQDRMSRTLPRLSREPVVREPHHHHQ